MLFVDIAMGYSAPTAGICRTARGLCGTNWEREARQGNAHSSPVSACLLSFFAPQQVFLLFWPVTLAVTYSSRNNFAIFLPPLFGFCFVCSDKEPSPAPNKLGEEEIASGWCNFLDSIPQLRLWDRRKRGFGLRFVLVGLSVTECFFHVVACRLAALFLSSLPVAKVSKYSRLPVDLSSSPDFLFITSGEEPMLKYCMVIYLWFTYVPWSQNFSYGFWFWNSLRLSVLLLETVVSEFYLLTFTVIFNADNPVILCWEASKWISNSHYLLRSVGWNRFLIA